MLIVEGGRSWAPDSPATLSGVGGAIGRRGDVCLSSPSVQRTWELTVFVVRGRASDEGPQCRGKGQAALPRLRSPGLRLFNILSLKFSLPPPLSVVEPRRNGAWEAGDLGQIWPR